MTAIPQPASLSMASVSVEQGDLRLVLTNVWQGGDAWLLAHADDGVIWGVITAGHLVLASDHYPDEVAPLRRDTLIGLRLFSAAQELRVWRAGSGLAAALVQDADPGADGARHFYHMIKRPYKLLGQVQGRPRQGLFQVFTGLAGQRHIVPGGFPFPGYLMAQHYYERLPNGTLRLAEHRLTGLQEGRTTA